MLPVATEAPRSRAVISPFLSRWRMTRTMLRRFKYSSKPPFNASEKKEFPLVRVNYERTKRSKEYINCWSKMRHLQNFKLLFYNRWPFVDKTWFRTEDLYSVFAGLQQTVCGLRPAAQKLRWTALIPPRKVFTNCPASPR